MINLDLSKPLLSQLTLVDGIILVFILLGILAWVVGFLALIYSIPFGIKFSLYLKKTSIWRKRQYFSEPFLTFKTFDPVRWGTFDPIENTRKKWRYIFNDQDTNDPEILYYKQKLRLVLKLFLYSMALFIFSIVATFLISLFVWAG